VEAASAPQPVATAEIKLSEEDRQRIAKDLGLDESQLDAVPYKLDIARYNDEDLGLDDDVSGFAFTPIGGLEPTTSTLGTLQFGKIPGGILVPL
jgi:hypothetical protein